MGTHMTIEQTVQGGRFVNRSDHQITLRVSEDFIADYGDDEPRAEVDIPAGLPLRASDVDALIRNLQTIRRAL